MSEPKRLVHGDGELSRLLVAAERDVLDAEAVARMRTRVAAATAASMTTALVASGKAAMRAKLAAAAIAIGAAGGFLAMHHRSAPIAPAPVVNVTASAAPVVVEAPAATERVATPELPTAIASAPPAPRAASKIVATASATKAPTSPREGLLLLRARQALRSDPARALALVRQHETEFPASQLAPERDKLRREAENKIDP